MKNTDMNRNEIPRRPVVAGIGEVLWDIFPGALRTIGGAPANVAYHAAALGAESHLLSAVGNDADGRELLRRLEAKGLQVGNVVSVARPTGTVSVELDAHGKPEYRIAENVAWDMIPCETRTEALARRLDAICFGTIAQRAERSAASIRRILDLTRADCIKVFDVNLRGGYCGRELLASSLERADVFKLSDEELPVVCRLLDVPSGEDAALDFFLRNFKLRLVALTKGSEGCRMVTRDEDVNVPGVRLTRMADTVGAGDAFTAMLTIGLLENRPLRRIAGQANRLAAFVCSRPGGMPAVPGNRKGRIHEAE